MADLINVLLTIKFSDEILDRFRSIAPDIKLKIHPAEKAKDVPNRVWEQVEVVYTTFLLPPVTLKTEIKWIHSYFAGVDRLLTDPFIVANPNVILTSSSGIHVSTMGEYVLGMILAFGHRVPTMIEHKNRSEWSEDRFKIFMPLELNKATVGILGYGSIGREIARLCKLFGAKVLATKRDVKNPEDQSYTLPNTGDPEGEMFDRLYPPEATAFMVKECDFVVVTLPLTALTKNSFDKRIFESMKPTAYLINVGRGGIIDETALLEALQQKRIAGAAFDVFNEEPLPADHPLWKAPNLIISPHISGNIPDYKEKAALIFEENLRRYVLGETLVNIVDRGLGY